MVKKTGKMAKGATPVVYHEQVIAYLAAVDLWKEGRAKEQINTIDCCVVTDNLYSLSKDVINTEKHGGKFFSSFVETYSEEHTSTTSGQTQRQMHLLDTLVQDKLMSELNNLYEEYTFATAKDASLTDDLRREQQQQRQQASIKQKLPQDADTTGDNSTVPPKIAIHSEDALVYGEIDLEGFCCLLRSLPPSSLSSKGIFYDIGSGSGRAVFAARFVGDFKQCIGIELLPNLHQLATSVQSLYKFLYSKKLQWQDVAFYCSDLLEYDWSDGTVVYAPSLLFDEGMMDKIAARALKLQSGACLVSLKKFKESLEDFHDEFSMIHEAVFPMSWGDSTLYVYQRQ